MVLVVLKDCVTETKENHFSFELGEGQKHVEAASASASMTRSPPPNKRASGSADPCRWVNVARMA